MNFSRLSKEKRNQLILVVVITVLSVAVLGLGVIRAQRNALARLADMKLATQTKLHQMEDGVKRAELTAAAVVDAKKTLATMESDIASGDLYSWLLTTIRRFRTSYKVEIPAFAPIGPTTDVTLLANFPYKQTSLSISGSAHYHDLGRFLSDLENQFPHMRVSNLNLDLDAAGSEPEMLSFRMDIIALVKNNPS